MDQLGAFLLLDLLPREGRLDVRAARDDVGQDAIARVLRGPALIDDDVKEEFIRSVAAALEANATSLCAVLDGGEANGDLWVVTERPAGETLNEVRRRARPAGGMTVAQVLRIGEDVARALDALHGAGARHAGVNARTVFVNDAGAVQLDGACAPLLRNDDEAASARTDQQQLGALLWEALIDRRLLSGSVEPPSTLRADVPPAVDAAIVRALSDDEPFDGFGELATALRLARESLPTAGSDDLAPLVAGVARADPPPSPDALASRRVDIPVFASDPPQIRPVTYVYGFAGLAMLTLALGAAFAAWSVHDATRDLMNRPSPPRSVARSTQPIPAPGPKPVDAAPATLILRGPGSHQEVLPPSSPTVIQVWLQGCADCMPKFERAKAARARGELDGLAIMNVAYGKADPSWATKWGVEQRLVFDAGSALVNPLGIGTFTPVIMFPDGRYKTVPITDTGYGAALRAALAQGPGAGDRRWQPPKR